MNVLVVSSWLPYPLDNGSRMRAYHLLRQLSRRHALTLLSLGAPKNPQDLEPLRALCRRVETVQATPLYGGRLGRRGLMSRVPRYFVQTDNPQMRALVSANIVGQDAAIALQVDAARYLGEWTGVARVFEEAEVAVVRERYLSESSLARRWRHGMTWLKFRRFVRNLTNAFERTTVVSDQEREHLRAIGCDVTRVSVIPNGVDIPSLDPPPVRTRRLIYPGSVAYFANLDAVRYFVREVFPEVRRSHPDVEFTVTGSTEGVDIRDLAAVDGVSFTGQLPEVDRIIAESALCVVPLRIGGGTRLKVLQAMALGTPVVSTMKGIEGLAVEPERHVFIGDSGSGFARQVLRVLAEPAFGRRVADEARHLVRERYAWGPIGEALERVLDIAVREHETRHLGRFNG